MGLQRTVFCATEAWPWAVLPRVLGWLELGSAPPSLYNSRDIEALLPSSHVGNLLLLQLWNAARTLVSLPFPFCKECDYGTCLYSLGILDFVLVLSGLGTHVKQIHHVPLDRVLLPSEALEGVGHSASTCSQLPTCLLHSQCGYAGLPLGSPVPGTRSPLRKRSCSLHMGVACTRLRMIRACFSRDRLRAATDLGRQDLPGEAMHMQS